MTHALTGTASGPVQPIAQGQPAWLAWIDDDDVPREHRAFVRRHVDRASRKLKIPPINVRWFVSVPFEQAEFFGLAGEDDCVPAGVAPDDLPMTVGFLASLRGEALKHVIAHEVRHVAQHLASGTYGLPRRIVGIGHGVVMTMPTRDAVGLDGSDHEADADAFATEYLESGAA